MLTGQILLQLIVILLVAQIFGYLCKRIGQPWVIGEILAGLALGPTLLGALLPKVETTLFPISALPTLQTLGDIGLVLYIFSLGARIDTHVMVRLGRKALVVSLGSMILPLALGTMLAFFLYPGLAGSKANLVSFMLLVGTALAITAFPVLARILTERNMLRTNTGMLALTCAAAGDVVAWCLLALVIAIIHAKGLASAAFTIGLTVLFIGIMLGVLRPLLLLADRWIQSKPLLLALYMILLLLSAYTTNAIGIHPVFGAFLMGIILPRRAMFIEPVPPFESADPQGRSASSVVGSHFNVLAGIDQTNNLLFLPLYFVYSGLRTQIGLISSPALWLICLLVLVIACVGKIFGGTFSARLVGETWKEAFTLGVLMNTRGLVELIVLNIGLDLGVLSPTLFAMLVIMAVITTMMAPPLLPLLGHKDSLEKDTANEIEEIMQG